MRRRCPNIVCPPHACKWNAPRHKHPPQPHILLKHCDFLSFSLRVSAASFGRTFFKLTLMGVDSSSPSYTPRNQAVSGTVPTKVAVAAGARSSHSLEVFSYKRIYFLAVLVLPFFLTSRSTAAALCGVVPAAACTWFKGVFGAFLEDSDPTHTHASAAFNASPSPAVAAVSVSILDVMKHWPLPAMLLAAVSVAAMLYTLFTTGRPHLLFAYNCFIKPFLLAKRVDGVAAGTFLDLIGCDGC